MVGLLRKICEMVISLAATVIVAYLVAASLQRSWSVRIESSSFFAGVVGAVTGSVIDRLIERRRPRRYVRDPRD